MIKNALQKYFIILKYYFIPLIILLLFLLIGVLATMSGIISSINELSIAVENVEGAASDAKTKFTDSLIAQGKSFLVTDESTETNFDVDGIKEIINNSVREAIGEIDNHETSIGEQVTSTVGAISTALVVLLIDLSGGLLISFYFTKWIARRKIIKRSLSQTIKSFAFSFPFLTLEMALIGFCIYLLRDLIIAYIILGLIIYSFGSLTKAYLIYKKEETKFKSIINKKTIVQFYLSILIVLLVGCGLGMIILLILRNLIGLLLAIPFVLIAMIEVSLNSESYVLEKIKC